MRPDDRKTGRALNHNKLTDGLFAGKGVSVVTTQDRADTQVIALREVDHGLIVTQVDTGRHGWSELSSGRFRSRPNLWLRTLLRLWLNKSWPLFGKHACRDWRWIGVVS